MTRRFPHFAALRHLRILGNGTQTVQLRAGRAAVEIEVLAPDLFRLRVQPGRLRDEPSWAVLPVQGSMDQVSIRRTGRRVAISTSAARFDLNLASGAWRLTDVHGLEIFSAAPGGMGFAGPEPRLILNLAEREAIFGLGETTGPLNKRGLVREFWNIDVLGHTQAIHPGLSHLYVSIPFAVSIRDGRAAGLFWDNPARQRWDLGQSRPNRWQMSAASGGIDLYLFAGPKVTEVLSRYGQLTGRVPLPPRWGLGYHQCRYSYMSGAELERVAGEFRRRRLPCDALYCDIDHLRGHRVFTFGRAFPKPAALLARLARRGFKVVTIVDPGVKDDPRFGVLRRGRKLDAFVKAPGRRRDFLGEAWPGRVRFPDFLQARVRAWWGEEQQVLQDLGVAGFWNDMNEPANFARPDKTLDPRCVHRTDFGRRTHAKVHNVYGMQMARASQEGAERHRPDERPFVISRAGYAGVQRHALLWTGDNSSCWEHLSESVQMLLNLGLSGVAFAGSDVGGFLDNPTPELFVRWLQMAVFTPFLRNHTNVGTLAQEPWAFGPDVEVVARRYLDLRYQLLPYLYGLFAESAETSAPIMRPLLWHFPGDPVAVACSDQFMLGSGLLVAPILRQGALARSVYLPRGEWFDFWDGTKFPGGIHVAVEAPLERIPVYVRAGTILPMTLSTPFVGAKESETVLLHVWPDDEGRLKWYDDDGRTRAHEKGIWERREMTSAFPRRAGWLRIGAREGNYAGHTRTWRVLLRAARRAFKVRVNGRPAAAEFVPELELLAFDIPVTDEVQEARWH